jgi:hypothetical protein
MSSRLYRLCWIALGMSAGLFASCAGRAPSAREVAVAQSFRPSSGKALLYVYRPSSMVQVVQKKHILLNGKSIGVNGSGDFLAVELSPGRYTVTAGSDPIQLTASPNRLYFIRQAAQTEYRGMTAAPVVIPSAGLYGSIAVPQNGFSFSSKLVTEAEGRQGIASCQQVASGTDF